MRVVEWGKERAAFIKLEAFVCSVCMCGLEKFHEKNHIIYHSHFHVEDITQQQNSPSTPNHQQLQLLFHVVNGEVKFDYRAQKFRVIPNWFFHFLLSSSASSPDLLLMILDADVCIPRSEFIAAILTYFYRQPPPLVSWFNSLLSSSIHFPPAMLFFSISSDARADNRHSRWAGERGRSRKRKRKLLMVVKLHHTDSGSGWRRERSHLSINIMEMDLVKICRNRKFNQIKGDDFRGKLDENLKVNYVRYRIEF